ncbi:MAG: hypothetical protein M1818_006472 [Claussenomyces sp. TS43310]|nr:MAG: hypothetical protein M1818_006472 [Claussenomyces sp. TS43310]
MNNIQESPSQKLLGSRVLQSDGEELSWRSFLKLDENTWLTEHAFLSGMTFPAAGYIAMAGECMRQLSESKLESFSLRNLSISSALVLSPDDKMELHTNLTPLSLNGEKCQWYEIQIASHNGNQWLDLCAGLVSREGALDTEVPQTLIPEVTCSKHISPNYWYDMIASRGLKYGASYRGLSEILASLTERKASATILPSHDTTDCILHPVTIDHCLQILMVAACKGQGRLLADLSVITSIKHLVVLNSGWNKLRVDGMVAKSHPGGLTCDLSAVNEEGLPILSMEHCIATLVSDRKLGSKSKLFSFMRWDTDVTYYNLNRPLAPFQFDLDPTIVLERLALLYALHLEDIVGARGQKSSKKIQNTIGSRKKGSFGLMPDISSFAECEPSSRNKLIELLKTHINGTELFSFGRALEQCLTCDAPFSGSDTERKLLLDQMHPFVRNNEILSESFRLFAHKNPKLRVLELGSGTNECTHLALKALESQFGEHLCLTYLYASTSPGATNKAKEKFKKDGKVEVTFFDTVKSVEEQGLKAGTYDLIITTDFMLPASDAKARAKYLKQLIHPHGHVVLLEAVPEPVWVSLLKDYLSDGTSMLQNEYKKEGSIEDVHTTLLESGFVFGCEDNRPSSGLKVVAELKKSPKASSQVTIIVPGYHLPLVREVEKNFNDGNITCVRRTLEGDIPPGQDMIVFVDFDEPYLYNITETGLYKFVKLVSGMRGSMIWVTPSAQVSCKNPNSSMILGMMRTVRSEFRKDITVVELDAKRSSNDSSSKSLLQIYQGLGHRTRSRDLDPDYEYAIVDGDIKIPRLQWTTAEAEFSKLAGRSAVEESLSQGFKASAGIGPASVHFRPDSCYLLVGGLGGLGRMISTWMVENGARNIMFLSRSAKEGPETTPFFDELRTQGCEVTTFAGSVTNLSDVEGAVKQATKPVAGIMQMSAVMRDNLMAQMTFAEWNLSVQPKVQGTWNLHHATSSAKLDFFLLFSSICGITGQWGQGNYNSANSFLDAFVNYRHGQNLPASVVDIGFMGSIGMAMESEALVKNLKGSGYYFLNERHLIDALSIAIAYSRPGRDQLMHKSQLGLGIRSTKPITSPSSRVAWKKDSRMAISHHFGSMGEIGDNEAKSLLKDAYGIRQGSD